MEEDGPIEAPRVETTFTTEDLRLLLAPHEPPCISVYLPIKRGRSEGRVDTIAFRNLARNVERMLANDSPGPAARKLVELLNGFDRPEIWEDCQAADGLCTFVSQDLQVAYGLQGPFPELEVVGATFHTKPLIRYLQGASLGYFLLVLNMRSVQLYEGLGESVREISVKGTLPEYEAIVARGSDTDAPDSNPVGQPSHRERSKTELEKLFRAIARDLWKSHFRASSRPVILAAPAQHQALFRKVAQIPSLLEKGIVGDSTRLDVDGLKIEAQRLLEPAIAKRVEHARAEFGLAKSRSQGTDSLVEIALLVVSGRVRQLFVESGRRIWGLMNPTTGEVLPGDASKNVHDVDLLDELAELTLARGGDVFVLNPEAMPTTTGIAAVLRY